MATIITGLGGDRVVQLGNEEIVRQMAIGNNWTKIRICARVIINGAANIAGGRLGIGVCSGTTDSYSSTNCVAWMGTTWPAVNGATLVYFSNASGQYYQYASGSSASWSVTSKVGSTVVDSANGDGNVVFQLNAGGSGRPGFVGCEITRSSTVQNSYSIRNDRTGSSLLVPMTRFDYLRACEDESFSVSSTWAGVGTTAVALNSMPLVPFDTASLYWNKSTPTIEISDFSVMRFA